MRCLFICLTSTGSERAFFFSKFGLLSKCFVILKILQHLFWYWYYYIGNLWPWPYFFCNSTILNLRVKKNQLNEQRLVSNYLLKVKNDLLKYLQFICIIIITTLSVIIVCFIYMLFIFDAKSTTFFLYFTPPKIAWKKPL